MSIDNEKMFSEYVLSVEGFSGRRSGISREKFLKISSELNDPEYIKSFSSREEARRALKQRASGSLGIIGFFILKTVVYWIIDKILDHYFR